MRKIFILTLIVFATFCGVAQEDSPQLYLLFEFMQVNDENGADYLEVEEFWQGVHEQRVANNKIIGWDLWSITPSGSMQGSQYLTVTLFSDLQSMLEDVNMEEINNYAKKAHPEMTEKELNAMMDKTVTSRDIAHQVYFKEIDLTTGDFDMKIGAVATLDVMKKLDKRYEKTESEIFKPWHQGMVDAGKKENWGLLKVILPSGSESYGTHLAVSMYKDVKQLAIFMEDSQGDMDFMTTLAVQGGLKTRDRKEMKIAKLIMMAR